MKRRLLAGVLTFVMMFSLLPATAFATEANGEDAGSETVVEQGYVPSGVEKKSDGTYENIPSNIQYKITEDTDGNQTLTFWSDASNAAFPTFNIEAQALTADGATVQVKNGSAYTSAGSVAEDDKGTYPNGYVTDKDGTKRALDANYIPYLWCTGDVYHYSKLPWYGYRNNITKVVFEESIAAFGRFTVCHMPKLEEVVIKNENCQVDGNAIYFNAEGSSNGGYQTSSQLTIMLSSKARLAKGAVANATSLRYQFTDVESYKETYADVFDGTNTDTEKAQEAWDAYQAFSDAAKQQLKEDTIGEAEITYYAKLMELANNGTINTYEVFASGNCPGSTTTHYELSSNDGNQTFVLRFYADEGSDGRMTDLIIDDANRSELHYGCAPWYQYGTKIVKVIYDESITRTGYLTAAHFYNCTRFEFLNPDVEVTDATIHYYDHIKAKAVEVYTAAANMPASCISYRFNDDSAKVTITFKTVWDFEAENEGFFTASETPDKAAVEAAMRTVAAWTSAQRTQLERDLIPGTQQSYMARLNAYAKVHGMSEMDSSEIVTGVCPVTTGIHYELRSYDGGKAYALRFYADSSSDGKMADYQVKGTNSGDPYAYEDLPWRNTSKTITSCTFDQSITYVGQFVAANIKSCTLYKFENPTVTAHKNAIYFYDNSFVDTNGVTIELYSGANMNGGPGGPVSTEALARVHFSYAEAKDFIAKYQALWTLSEGEAPSNIETIKAAQKELSALPQVVQDQLNTDKIPGTETTYAAKLTQLMAKLNLGGSCGENANYALTDNGDDTYTLRITGSGALKDYSTSSAPWAGYSSQITKVTIGSGITKLTKGAFSGLTALKSVDVPESVTEIAEGAFPETAFELYGYSNHASGKYAEAHSNVQLRLKSLRILCMGNSHTGDYTQYLQNALNDMKAAGVETNITYTLSPSAGGRQLYYWPKQNLTPEERKAQDDRGSHYWSANDPNADVKYLTYDKYQNTFKSTWDLIVVQDFHESTANDAGSYPGGASYAKAMQEVVKWLNKEAPGAKIAWFADWAEKASNSGNLNVSYANSVAAMNAIEALTEYKPDYIIPASTVLQNARTSYLGTVHNPSNVLLNNKKSDGKYVFPDCAVDNMQAYTVLERDATHMSLELGRQLMATAFVYNLLQDYGQQIITPEDFDFFAALNTQPEYKNGNCYWLGEMTADNWAIIKEACENANTSSRTVTNSIHTTDPFDAKYARVKAVIAKVSLPANLSQDTLEAAFKSDDVVNALNAIDGISVTKDSISITYQAAVNGTAEKPTGADGKLMVKVDCHYGYTYPTEPALNMILKANMEPGAEAALKELKQTAINKLNSYMHNDSYTGTYQEQVETAKNNGIVAITAAASEGEVTAALLAAEGVIDTIPTLFETKVVPDANCVARGQIWTGGWNHEDGGSGGIEKNYYTLDYTNSTDKKDSTFIGVWWVIRNDGKDGYSLEFCKDPGTGYSFVIPDYNANHWLDTWHVHKSYNPLQYNKTPWFTEYGKKITSATIDSGITVGRFTLACFPNIQTYTIKDNVTLNADSIYFNPIETDVKVNFEGSAVLAKSAFSAYGVQNSYAYYVDVSGDMSQVKKTDGNALSGDLSYAFGKYRADSQSFDTSSGTYYMNATGLDGAPHYTNGVPDGTKMLRVFNSNNTTHTHTLVTIPAVTGCDYNLSEGSYCSVCGAIVQAQVATKGTGSHQWTLTKTVDPAVDKEGYKTYTCSVCHVEKVESIPATAVARIVNPDTKEVKNYDNVEDAVEAAAGQVGTSGTTDVTVNLVPGYNLPDGTTTGSGVTIDKDKGTIKVTDSNATITVPKDVHSFSEEWSYDAANHWHACTVAGHTDKKNEGPHTGGTATCSAKAVCEVCGQAYGGFAAHSLTKTETKEATCTEAGNSAYWTCNVCGKYFSDENGTNEIEKDSWVLKALGHDMTKTDAKKATCTEDGNNEYYTCSRCGGVFKDEAGTQATTVAAETLEKLGHDWSNKNGICVRCGAKCTETHKPGTTCEVCGKYTRRPSSSNAGSIISVPSTPNGTVTVNPSTASKDETVTITTKPSEGYELGSIEVLDKNGDSLKLKDLGNGKYSFVMPDGKVSVEAEFVKTAATSFADVPANAYFADAVKWAVDKGITNGLSDTMFGPYESCTRAQIVTFLWRAAGSPEPKTASSFTDVPVSTYYAKAVAWAVENGITNGMTATMFAPDATCTRGQSVTFLHRALKGTASGSANFTDVKSDAFYADAINWAVANNVTNGTSNTTFSPNADCTRAEIVTFLYRAYQGK